MIKLSQEGTDTQGILAMLEASVLRAEQLADTGVRVGNMDTRAMADHARALYNRVKKNIDPEGWHVLVGNWNIDGAFPGEKRYLWAMKVKGDDKPASLQIECTPDDFRKNTGRLMHQFIPSKHLERVATGSDSVSAVARLFKREFEAAQTYTEDNHLVIRVPLGEVGQLRQRLG